MVFYGANKEVENLLREAMWNEQISIRSYQILAQKAPNAKDERQIRAIRRQERLHYVLLADMYEEITGVDFVPGSPSVSLPKDFCGMIKTAIYDELASVRFYEKLAKDLDCARQQKRLREIINDEKHQARILAAIYHQCSHQQLRQTDELGYENYFPQYNY
ncbi:MAG: hypothetical protein ACOX05_05620 [Bacillota bacterium]|jgi:rubrerythrin